MRYYFVNDNKNKRHIIVAKNIESLTQILHNSKMKDCTYYELVENSFKDEGFLVSDI